MKIRTARRWAPWWLGVLVGVATSIVLMNRMGSDWAAMISFSAFALTFAAVRRLLA